MKDIVKDRRAALWRVVQGFRSLGGADRPYALIAAMGAYAASRVPIGPLWLLVRTSPAQVIPIQPVKALEGLPGAISVVELTPANLLSSARGKARGILSSIGERGTFLCQDGTSLFGSSVRSRSSLAASLRCVFDGDLVRLLGGKEVRWKGQCGSIVGIPNDQNIMDWMNKEGLLTRFLSIDVEHAQPVLIGLSRLSCSLGLSDFSYKDEQNKIQEYIKNLLDPSVVPWADSKISKEERKFIAECAEFPRTQLHLSRLLTGLKMLGCDGPECRKVLERTAETTLHCFDESRAVSRV